MFVAASTECFYQLPLATAMDKLVELEYSSVDLAAFDPVVNRLVSGLKDSGTGWQC